MSNYAWKGNPTYFASLSFNKKKKKEPGSYLGLLLVLIDFIDLFIHSRIYLFFCQKLICL